MDRVVLERCARRVVHAVAVGLTAGLAGMASCAPDRTRDEPSTAAPVNAGPPASSYESSPVRLELISDVDRVQPGVAFRLGVLVTLETGWFVHWRYAGVSGQATTVDLTMPYDFEAGPVAWPTPSRFERSDGTTRYGYAERVLLTSVIQASNVGDDVYWPFEADVGLVACATECVSAHATLGLALHHSVSGTRLEHFANRRLFDEWAVRVPTPSDAPERAVHGQAHQPDWRCGAGNPPALERPARERRLVSPGRDRRGLPVVDRRHRRRSDSYHAPARHGGTAR